MRILVLGGTAEARALAARLADGHDVTLSLAGVTRAPLPHAGTLRTGGFGGQAGLTDYLRAEAFEAVIDATHPFAEAMPHTAHAACSAAGLPRLRLLRPEWAPAQGDAWHAVGRAEDCADIIPAGARAFLATGPRRIDRFAELARGRCLVCRRIDPPDAPFPYAGGEYLVARPPFTLAQEVETFRNLRIDWLVSKNAGGDAGRAKLDAARDLGIAVAMIARPVQPAGPCAETVVAAVNWINRGCR